MNDVVQFRLLDAGMTDWDFKDHLLALRKSALKELIVLPAYLRRARQLLAGSQIKVGAVIDYPLGNGTVAKKAFEVGKAFQEGADFVELTLCVDVLLHDDVLVKRIEVALRPLALAWGDVRIRVEARKLKELTKVELSERVRKLGWQFLVLAKGNNIDTAKYDATLFSYDTSKQLKLQINLEACSDLDIQELVMRGVKKVGVFYLENLDLEKEVYEYGRKERPENT